MKPQPIHILSTPKKRQPPTMNTNDIFCGFSYQRMIFENAVPQIKPFNFLNKERTGYSTMSRTKFLLMTIYLLNEATCPTGWRRLMKLFHLPVKYKHRFPFIRSSKMIKMPDRNIALNATFPHTSFAKSFEPREWFAILSLRYWANQFLATAPHSLLYSG